ncbi:MAG: hypothetical protein C0468_04460 [Planctomyces sp.]|nr:hypothetical protein [Planctomyces sp.]
MAPPRCCAPLAGLRVRPRPGSRVPCPTVHPLRLAGPRASCCATLGRGSPGAPVGSISVSAPPRPTHAPDTPAPLTQERERQLLALYRAAHAAGAPADDALSQLLLPITDQLHATILRVLAGGRPISAPDRLAADDLSHDALVSVIGALPSFDGTSRLATWATRIAINTALTHRRRQRLRAHRSLSSTEQHTPDPLRSAADSELVRDSEPRSELAGLTRVSSIEPPDDHASAVAAALLTLPTDQQEVLLLRDARGLDYQHIAAALDVSLGTVKSRLFRARMSLRAALQGPPPTGA